MFSVHAIHLNEVKENVVTHAGESLLANENVYGCRLKTGKTPVIRQANRFA